MAFSVKGSVTIRKADGTDYASPDADVVTYSLKEVTDCTLFQTGNTLAASGGSTIVIPATIYGVAIHNPSTNTAATTVALDGDSINLAVGQTLVLDDTDLSAGGAFTLTNASDEFVELTMWGK